MYGAIPYTIGIVAMTRTARIDMRLTEEEKRLIEQVSAATGSRLTTWCINPSSTTPNATCTPTPSFAYQMRPLTSSSRIWTGH